MTAMEPRQKGKGGKTYRKKKEEEGKKSAESDSATFSHKGSQTLERNKKEKVDI